MKRYAAFLLPFLICAGQALADETINQLSKGATLQGSEMIPMFQGANPAVTTTPQAIMNLYSSRTNTIDATTATGTDMCAKISAAATALAASSPGGGMIDARGFVAKQHCSGSMFASWPAEPFTATVLLGYVDIQTDVTQQIPTATWLRGTLALSDSGTGPQGSQIQTSNAFPANAPVVSIGPCCAPEADGANGAFYTQVDHLGINCIDPAGANVSGSIGLQNLNGQEGTEVDYIHMRGCFTGLQVAGGAGDGNLYKNITIVDTGINTSGSPNAFVCIQIGTAAADTSDPYDAVSEISDATCGGTSSPTNEILVDGWNWKLKHIRFETDASPGNSAGVNIGSQTANGLESRNITIDDFVCAGTVGLAAGGACVKLSAGALSNINLFNILGGGTGAGSYVLNDTGAGGCTIPASVASALGFYSRGDNGRIETTSTACHGGAATSGPTVSSCGTGAALSQGNDFGGYINAGSGTVTSCLLKFAQAFANQPNCVASARNTSSTPVAAALTARSTTSITISTAATVGGGQIQYQCSQE